MDWDAVFGSSAWIPMLAASVRLSMPIAVAAAGECIAERSGTLNLGLEGMMLTGALGAFIAADKADNETVGVLAGIIAGTLVAVLIGYFVLRLAVDQVVVGVATVILAGGATTYVYTQIYGSSGTLPQLNSLGSWSIPGLSAIPGIGPVLFEQTWPTYLGALVPFVLWALLFRSRLGLEVLACGENPGAAQANGIDVIRTRWWALLITGALAGLAGAMLVIDVNIFRPGLTAGRGWIAIGLVIVARWNPIGALVASGLFGFTTALQLRIQAASGGISSDVPFEIFQALPYLATFVVVVIATLSARRDSQPSALGASWTAS